MSSLSAPAGAGAAVPSCVEIEGECAKSGWIYKQSKHVKKWNKRYFVLWPKVANPKKGRLLFYYTTPQVRAQWLRATLPSVQGRSLTLALLLEHDPAFPVCRLPVQRLALEWWRSR